MNVHPTKTPAVTQPLGWRLASATTPRCLEWTGFAPPPPELGTGADRRGAVCRRPDGTPICLHPAPDRWLVPDAPEPLVAALQSAERDGQGACVEVSGRWRVLRLAPGAEATATPHPLSAAMPLALVLAERGCAALWAFDCPVIVAADDGGGHDVWLEASYESSFTAMLATLGVRL